jgi:hypothetical protein
MTNEEIEHALRVAGTVMENFMKTLDEQRLINVTMTQIITAHESEIDELKVRLAALESPVQWDQPRADGGK